MQMKIFSQVAFNLHEADLFLISSSRATVNWIRVCYCSAIRIVAAAAVDGRCRRSELRQQGSLSLWNALSDVYETNISFRANSLWLWKRRFEEEVEGKQNLFSHHVISTEKNRLLFPTSLRFFIAFVFFTRTENKKRDKITKFHRILDISARTSTKCGFVRRLFAHFSLPKISPPIPVRAFARIRARIRRYGDDADKNAVASRTALNSGRRPRIMAHVHIISFLCKNSIIIISHLRMFARPTNKNTLIAALFALSVRSVRVCRIIAIR